MEYPPAALTGLLPLGATPERDAISELIGNSTLKTLCTATDNSVKVYLGIKPHDSTRPYILVSRDRREHEYGSCGGMAGISETTIGVVITVVDEHYQRCMDLETLVLQSLENKATPNVRRWSLASTEYPADVLDDSTGRAIYNAVLSFRCEMRSG